MQTKGHKRKQMNTKHLDSSRLDFSSEFSEQLVILEDLISVTIDEIGNGGTRSLSILLSAIRHISDLKATNNRLLEFEKNY